MTFERFIARRYLFSGQRKALVSVITFISVAGVAVGVFALVVVLAVMDGFTTNLIEKIIGAYAHIDIYSNVGGRPWFEADPVMKAVTESPGVKAAAPVIQGQALAHVPDPDGLTRQAGMFIMGINPQLEPKVTSLMNKTWGERAMNPGTTDVVISRKIVVEQLGIPLEHRLRLISPVSAPTPEGEAVIQRAVRLAGMFETGFPEMDQMFSYMSLDGARRLFNVPEGEVGSVHLMVNDPQKVEDVKAVLQQKLGADYRVTSWQDRNRVLFDALVLEKWAMFIILLLIVLVAAFNIIGTLIMVVTEKTREIGILKSMGATEQSIMRIFLVQGMIIGLVGTSVGATLGLLTCYLLKYHIRLPVNTAAYLSDRIPVLVTPWTTAAVIISSLVICLLASLYPARAAAKLDPVESLRYE